VLSTQPNLFIFVLAYSYAFVTVVLEHIVGFYTINIVINLLTFLAATDLPDLHD